MQPIERSIKFFYGIPLIRFKTFYRFLITKIFIIFIFNLENCTICKIIDLQQAQVIKN